MLYSGASKEHWFRSRVNSWFSKFVTEIVLKVLILSQMLSSLELYGMQCARSGAKKKPKIREFEDEIIAFVAMVVQGERTKTAVANLLNCYDLLRRA